MKKNAWLVWIGLGITLLAAFPLSVAAAPQQQGENLLQNGGFEGDYSAWNGIPQIQMPAGWTPWWADNNPEVDPPWKNLRPEWKPAEGVHYPTRVHSGARAIQWFKGYGTFFAGASQQVNVPENAQLRFTAWGLAWSCADWDMCRDASSYDPANMGMRIGIDPTGGTNPWSASIVWSGFASPTNGWLPFQVDATAQGTLVTVFLYSNPDWPKENQDAYFDDASLVVLGEAPPPATVTEPPAENPPPAAPPPAPVIVATATPMSDGSIIHTVSAGETLWTIAVRYGLSLDEIKALNDIGTFILPGQKLLVRPANQEAPAQVTPTPEDEAATAAGGGTVEEPPTTEPEQFTEEAPAEEPLPEAIAAETSGSTLCVMAFRDQNADGVRDEGEGLLAGALITVLQGQQMLGNYTTDGASEPYCFTGLEAGNYRITQALGDNWSATTPADWGITLQPGEVTHLEFGGIESGDSTPAEGNVPAADPEAPAESTWERVRSSLCTGGGVFGILLVVGAVVFMVLSRRAS